MADARILGLDVGTQGTKGIVLDADRGETIARASAEYGLIEGLPAGAAEQDPRTWLEAIEAVLGALGREVDLGSIRAVGVSGQQHGFVPMAADGRVLRPAKLWCDTATIAEARELETRWGRPLPVGFTASKILWLQRHEPERWAELARVALPHDYVNFVLTGRFATECGDASGTGIFDPIARSWDSEAAGQIGDEVPAMLPELVDAGEVFGHVHEAAAGRFGLARDCVVSVGGGDNMMAAIGAGAVRPGIAVLSLGTSGTVFARSDAPIVDADGIIAPFCDSAGGWLPLLCVMNLTLVTEEIRNAFGLTHGEVAARANAVEIGSDGLRMLPFLQGERTPALPSAAGTLEGMRSGWLEPGRLYRAALEGCVCNLALGSQRLVELGVPLDRLRLVGGAAKNPVWQKAFANAFGLPVEQLHETESAALGAALQALWTWRRREDSTLALSDVVDPWVKHERARQPEPGEVAEWGDLLDDWKRLLAERHGV